MNHAILMTAANLSLGELLATYGPYLVRMILRVVVVLVVFAIGRRMVRVLVGIVDRALEHHDVEITIRKFLKKVLTALGYVMLAMILMEMVGVAETSLAAAFASCGVAIGLALQGSLSNFAGGILILLIKPFVVGDYLIVGSMEGKVKEIGLVYTKLTTGDNREALIPNGSLANGTMINVTANATRRVDITVGIGYDSDLKLAKELLWKVGQEDPARVEEQEAVAMVSDLGASAVNLVLRVWVATSEYAAAKSRMTEKIKEAFDEAGIEIPYNQVDVHMR